MIKPIKFLQSTSNSVVLTSIDIKSFLLSLHFSNNFKHLLYRKNILVTEFTLNLNANRIDLHLKLYYRKKRLIKFRKTKLKKNNFFIKSKESILFYLLKIFKDQFNINTLFIKLKVLNRVVIFHFLFKKLKKSLKFFKKSLFERRINLYLDFLKIVVLYQTSQVNSDSLTMLLGEIFQRLSKKKHGTYLKFIKILFKKILVVKDKEVNDNIFNTIKGAKFILAGKIKGKLRAKTTTVSFGSVPINTESKNIQFAHTNVFTIYGKYGIKLWIYQIKGLTLNLLKIKTQISRLRKSKRFIVLFRKRFKLKKSQFRSHKKRIYPVRRETNFKSKFFKK